MARIRTVKPEFWTDEKVVECSIAARLLFIGLFNFANDKGCLERSPRRIKMQVFPADSMDCEPLIQELITHGLLTEYSVNGVQYLHISGFLKHQKINRPSQTNIPLPPKFTDNSANAGCSERGQSQSAHEQSDDGSMSAQGGLTDGMEGKGKDLKDKTPHTDRAGANDLQAGESAAPAFANEYWLDDPAVKFPMTADWQPSPDFRQRAALWGKALSGPELGYTPAELASFVAYWQPEGKVFHQAQWELKFADHLRKQPAATASSTGNTKGRRRGNFEPSGNYDEIPPGFK